jgi:hypothetical protein
MAFGAMQSGATRQCCSILITVSNLSVAGLLACGDRRGGHVEAQGRGLDRERTGFPLSWPSKPRARSIRRFDISSDLRPVGGNAGGIGQHLAGKDLLMPGRLLALSTGAQAKQHDRVN